VPAHAVPVFERIMRRTVVNEQTACWECDLSVSKRWGYARVCIKRAAYFGGVVGSLVAHRVIYTLLVGPVADGLVLDHLCRVRHCVNPAHLEPTTYHENVVARTTLGKSAINARKRLRVRGHRLDGDNLALRPDGHRNCRECKLAQQRANYGDRQRTYAREWYRRNRDRLKAQRRGGAA
jgi:HNH endonuclease